MNFVAALIDWLAAVLFAASQFVAELGFAISSLLLFTCVVWAIAKGEEVIEHRFGSTPIAIFHSIVKWFGIGTFVILPVCLFVWFLGKFAVEQIQQDGAKGILKVAWGLIASPFYMLCLVVIVLGPLVLIGMISDHLRKAKRRRDANKKPQL